MQRRGVARGVMQRPVAARGGVMQRRGVAKGHAAAGSSSTTSQFPVKDEYVDMSGLRVKYVFIRNRPKCI